MTAREAITEMRDMICDRHGDYHQDDDALRYLNRSSERIVSAIVDPSSERIVSAIVDPSSERIVSAIVNPNAIVHPTRYPLF